MTVDTVTEARSSSAHRALMLAQPVENSYSVLSSGPLASPGTSSPKRTEFPSGYQTVCSTVCPSAWPPIRTKGSPSPAVSRVKVRSAGGSSTGSLPADASSAFPKATTQARAVTSTTATAAHKSCLGALAMRVNRSFRLFLSPAMVVAQRSRSTGPGLAVTSVSRVLP